MALYFSEAVQAAIDGETLGVALLTRLDFVEGERRLFLGSGSIEIDGELWSGLGEMAKIGAVNGGFGDTADAFTMTLSGVDPQIEALCASAAATIQGRRDTQYLQFFHADGKPIESPVVIRIGTMDRMEVDGDATTATVTAVSEDLFVNRSKPPAGTLSDADQQARFPGDLGCEFVNTLIYKDINWPG